MQAISDPGFDNEDIEKIFMTFIIKQKDLESIYMFWLQTVATKFSRLKMSKKRIGTADKPATVEVGSLM